MPLVPLNRTVKNEQEMVDLAQHMAQSLRPGDVLLLQGDLGMGKTTFARAVIRHLMGAEITVPSPTFSLVQTYDLPNGVTLWHYDLYRLKHPDEIWELGLEDAINDGISLIEWPERMGSYRPATAMLMTITESPDDPSPTARQIAVTKAGVT